MGLDNLPHRYPCAAAGTAITSSDGAIDCAATREAHQCPYVTAYDAAGSPAGRVYGIMGVPCWYRGKSGNYILEILGSGGFHPPAGGFFGDGDDDGPGPQLTPDYCRHLADWLEAHADEYRQLADQQLAERYPDAIRQDLDGFSNELTYAVWWLRWVAEHGGGSDTWY